MSLTNINAVAKMSVFLEWFFLDVVLPPIVVVLLAIHSHLANHFLHLFRFLPSFLAYFYLPISFISTYTRTDRQGDRERQTDIERDRKLNRETDMKQNSGSIGFSERRKWSIKPDGNGQSIWRLKTPRPP